MYPISAAFVAALKRPHTVISRVDVFDGGVKKATVQPVDGLVEVDTAARIRRRCTLELVDPTGALTPTSLNDLLAPAGNEIRPYRGIRLPDGTDEYVPLGVFGVADSEILHTSEGVRVAAQGFDRSRKVSKNRWAEPHIIASGTNVATAIKDLIDNRLPGLTFSFTTTTRTTPVVVLGLEVDNDPWVDAQTLARSIGCEVLFGPTGVCVLRTLVSAASEPSVMTYDSTLLQVTRRLSDERTYNRVVVRGQHPDGSPIRKIADDDDPDSPTYVGDPPGSGDFGLRPYFLTSQLITVADQGQDAADGLLEQVSGVVEDVNFDAIVNPAHDGGDVIRVTDGEVGIDTRYSLSALTVPMRVADPMPAITRKRRVQL